MRNPKKERHLLIAEAWLGGIVTILLFVACGNFFGGGLSSSEKILLYMQYAVSSILLNRIYNAYAVGRARVFELVCSQSLANVISVAITYCALALISKGFPGLLPFVGLIAVQFAWNILWSWSANALFFRFVRVRRTAVVYETDEDLLALKEIFRFEERYDVKRKIRKPDSAEKLLTELEGLDTVFLLGRVKPEIRKAVVCFCVERGMTGYAVPENSEIIMAGAQHMQMYSVPLMQIRRARPTLEYLAFKRLMDIVFALIAGVVASPIMLLTAIAIRLCDGGPVFYRQTRLTKDGKRFSMIKFRSMRVDAESDGVARLASAKDARITPVGRVIRACRIDELPQLYNILVGDMTIVGPRPERPEIAAEYEKEMPEFALRLQVKAGLTGLAQVYGRYDTDPKAKLGMDLMYISKMSVAEDVRLILATVKALLMKERADGVRAESARTVRDQAFFQNKMSA